jgi:hydroxyethylthiazole kinase-like uncharacterized protein yjeF
MLVAGSMGNHGAAVLAARGALRAQPGLVSLVTQEAVYHPIAAQLTSALVDVWSADIHRFDSASALLFGPGLGAPDVSENVKAIFRRLWRDTTVPLVVDASAVGWLYPHSLAKGTVRVVATHAAEVATMLRQTVAEVEANRERTIQEISKRFGNCWVVLKGPQAMLGNHDGAMHINTSGNPWLIQGGSGDVLAGYMAGLLAQPALQTDIVRTVRFALWQHGAAADALQARQKNWIVEDLVQEVGSAR